MRKQNKNEKKKKKKKKETKGKNKTPLVTSEEITSTVAVCSTSAGRPAAQLRVKGTAYCGAMVAT